MNEHTHDYIITSQFAPNEVSNTPFSLLFILFLMHKRSIISFWGEVLGVEEVTPELTSVTVGNPLMSLKDDSIAFVLTMFFDKQFGSRKLDLLTTPFNIGELDWWPPPPSSFCDVVTAIKFIWRPYRTISCLRGPDTAFAEGWRPNGPEDLILHRGLWLVTLDRDDPGLPLDRDVPVV